jgi:integrase
VTFREASERFLAVHSESWKNPKHRQQWANTLETYAHPVLGDLDVATLDENDVVRCLEPIWHTKPETASRVRGRIERIIDRCRALKIRTAENPAAWKGKLEHLLARRKSFADVIHHPALPVEAAPSLMADLRAREGVSASALAFLISTCGRTVEVQLARWDEIDWDDEVWEVPAERMKMKKAHRVPLSSGAMAVLKKVVRIEGNPFIFVGSEEGTSISGAAMSELLKGMRLASTTPGKLATVHGMRSTFRDWAGDHSAFPREVIEAALAHKIPDKAEASYRRSDALEKRRKLMEAWSSYLARPKAVTGAVVPMRRKAAR